MAEELSPKMLFPVLPAAAADELPKVVLLKIPNPASCLLEDDTGKSVVKTGEDPNLKKGAGDEDVTTEEELLEVIVTAVLAVMLLLVETAVAVLLLLAPRDELLNIFWLVKLFETGVGKGEENEVFEGGPLF